MNNIISKYLMKQKFLFVFLILSTAIFTQSCDVLSLVGNGTSLSEDMAYNSIELQGSSYMKKIPLNCSLNLGYGSLYREKTDYVGYGSGENKSSNVIEESGWSFGLTPSYYLTSSRFQPVIACNFNSLWTSANVKKEGDETSYNPTYLSLTPSAGFRFFFSSKFAITGSCGYQWGKLDLEGKDIPSKTSGTSISFGLTLTY